MEQRFRTWLDRLSAAAGRRRYTAVCKRWAARFLLAVSGPGKRAGPVPLQRPSHLPSLRATLGVKTRPAKMPFKAGGTQGTQTVPPPADYAVVIWVHDDLSRLRRCLMFFEEPAHHTVPVVLVDDASDPYVSECLSEFAAYRDHVDVIRNESFQGPAASFNAGIRAVRDKDVLLLEPRGLMTADLAANLSASARNESVGIAVPVSNTATDVWLRMIPGCSYRETARLLARIAHAPEPVCVFPEEGCIYVRRQVIDRAGLFNTRYNSAAFAFLDYVLRAAKYGFTTVCCTRAFVHHQAPPSLGSEIDVQADTAELLQNWSRFEEMAQKDQAQQVMPALRRAIAEQKPPHFLYREEAERYYHETFNEILRDPALPQKLEQYDTRLAEFLKQKEPVHRRTPRIVFLVNRLMRSGGVLVVADLVNDLILQGLDVRLVVHSPRTYDPAIQLLTEPIFFRDREDLVEHFPEADLVVGTFWNTMFAVAELFLRRNNFIPAYFVQDFEPYFLSEHDKELREWCTRTYRLTPWCFAFTPWTCDRVREAGGKIIQVPPAIDLDVFYPRATRPVHPEKAILTMFRPWTPRRGFTTAIEVFRQLASRRTDFVVHSFGSNDEDLEQHRLPFPHINHGRVPNARLPELYRHAYCFTEFSQFHGFGRTIAESFACGTPAVVTRSGGTESFCVNGVNALVADDTDGLAACLERLLDDPALRESLAQNCRGSVLHFDRIASARYIATLLRSIL